MDTKALRQKILDLAIRGKLVPQDPSDEPASVLLDRIRAEKQQMVKEGKLKAKDIKNDSVIFKGEDNLHYEKFADGTVNCIEDEIPFDLPDGWEWTRIQSTCIINPKNQIDDNLEVSFVPMAYISDGYTNSFISEKRAWKKVKKGYTHFADGDIGIAKITPCFENKKSVIFNGLTNHFGAGTTELHIIRCFPKSLLPEYLFLFVKRDSFIVGGVQTFAGDVGQQRVTKDYITSYLFPVPPYSEQKRIITSVKNSFDAIDQIERSNKDIEKIVVLTKDKILDLAIRGKLVPQDPTDEPASALLERIRAEKEELIKQGKIKRDKGESVIFKGEDNSYYLTDDEDISFSIPKSWMWIKHNDLFEISGGSQPPKSYFVDKKIDGYVRLFQIRDYGKSPQPVYIPESLASKQTDEGDILLARYGGSLGKVFKAKKGAYNVALAKVIFLQPDIVYKNFVFYYYKSSIYQKFCARMGLSRNAQSGFNKGDLSELYFPLPPLKEQIRIVKAIEDAFTIVDSSAENL